MLALLIALALAAPASSEARVAWDPAGDHIENCRVIKSTGDPKMDAKICAAVACSQRMDVRTGQGELLAYRKQDCEHPAGPAKRKR